MYKKILLILITILLLFIGIRYVKNNDSGKYVLRIYQSRENEPVKVAEEVITDHWCKQKFMSKNQDLVRNLLDTAKAMKWETVDSFHDGQYNEIVMLSKGGLVLLQWNVFIDSNENIAYIYLNNEMCIFSIEEYRAIVYGEKN